MALVEDKPSTLPYGSLLNEDAGGGGGVTVEEAVEQSGFGWFQARLLLISSLLLLSDAMEILLLAVLGPELRCAWNLSEYKVALITSLVFLGMFLGSSASGLATDVFGRRPILILIGWWTAFFGLLTSFAPNIIWMYVLRFLVGFGLAGSLLTITLFMEYVPKSHRGKSASISLFAWPVGVLLQSVLAILIVPYYGWRWLVIVSAIPMLICAVLFSIWLPESARYLLVSDQAQEARSCIQIMAKVNGQDFDGKLITSQQEQPASVRDLFHPTYRRTTLILAWMWFAGGFIYYGNVILSADSGLLRQSCFAANAVVKNVTTKYYGCEMKCNGLSRTDFTNILITSVGELFGPLTAILLVDVIGRRRCLTLTAVLASIGYFLLQFCYPALLYTIISLVTRAMCSAHFTLIMVYSTEVYPTSVRGLSFGLGNSMTRIGAMITPFFGQVLASVSPTATIYVYVIVGIISVIVSLFLSIETKGRSMKQTVHDAEDDGS